jgi:2-phosphosulfolactate phosphatase
VAVDYFRSHRHNPLGVLSLSGHGQWLAEIGLGDDLPVCATFDKYPVVPVRQSDGWLGLYDDQRSQEKDRSV